MTARSFAAGTGWAGNSPRAIHHREILERSNGSFEGLLECATDFARNQTLGVNEESEQNALSAGGVIANAPYELIPNTGVRYITMAINDAAFGAAHHGSDGDSTLRDGVELLGGVYD